jgi:hypothetical protein
LEVIGAVWVMYGAAAVYCQSVVGNLFQFAYLVRPSGNSLRRGELFVLLPCFWRDGEKLVLGDGDRDVQGTVDDFADDGGVFNGGGVSILGPGGVGGSGIFDGCKGDSGDSDGGSRWSSGTGGAGVSPSGNSCMIWLL